MPQLTSARKVKVAEMGNPSVVSWSHCLVLMVLPPVFPQDQGLFDMPGAGKCKTKPHCPKHVCLLCFGEKARGKKQKMQLAFQAGCLHLFLP